MLRFNDRALLLGSTGSGKSEVLNYLFAMVRCQRLLLDTKDEFQVPGVDPVSRVDGLDWDRRTLHFRASPTAGVEEFDELFQACYERPGALVVCVHELGDICEFQPNRTPRWFNAYLSKGRARSKGLYAGSQRPFQIPTRARSESDHVFMIGERFLLPDDHKAVAEAMGQPPGQLAKLIDDVQDELGGEPDPQGRTHAYLWFRRHRREVIACPPLPAEHRQIVDVQRTLAVDAPQGGASTDRTAA